MDILGEMLRLQRDFQSSLDYEFEQMTTQERVEYISWNVQALTAELYEMLDEMSWKPWQKAEFLKEDKAFGELIDAFHFMMNIAMVINSRDDWAALAVRWREMYETKRGINLKRQENNYDGVSTKCPKCKRALDEPNAIKSKSNDTWPSWHYCSGCGCELNAHFTDEAIEQLLGLTGSIEA